MKAAIFSALPAVHCAELFCGDLEEPFHDHLGTELIPACRQLRRIFLTVAEVASGYAEAIYSAHLFHQVPGCSPRAWRTRFESGAP